MEIEALPAVVGELSYVPATVREAVTWLGEPPPGLPRQNFACVARPCEVRDARALRESIDLDGWGFCLVRHRTAADLADDGAVEAVFYPEARKVIAEVTGAARVVVFGHAVRDGEERHSVNQVHADYTEGLARAMFDHALGEEASRLAGRRFCQVNLWRSIRQPVLDAPLAMCAAWSSAPEDLVLWRLRGRDRDGELYLARHSDRHRWFYFPLMGEDEMLVIKNFDSDPARASYTLHSAFADPATPAGAPPRRSIELRALAIF